MFDVNEIEDIAERVDGTRRVDVLIDMSDHLEAFAVKVVFFNEEIRYRRLAIIGNNFLPPDARGSIELGQ